MARPRWLPIEALSLPQPVARDETKSFAKLKATSYTEVTMKRFNQATTALLGITVLSVLTASVCAQSEPDNDLEEVIVTEYVQSDAAMTAFRAGDFVKAEVEFLDNAKCALRQERQFLASANSQRTNIDRAANATAAQGSNVSVSAGAGGTVSVTSAPAGANDPGVTSGLATAGQSRFNETTSADRTCENRGFQLYMAGLSQIQLGKRDRALDNFQRATVLSKVLYDAHYKIGLISILDEDMPEAKDQLRSIGSILKRCKKCSARPEILARYQHLEKSLAEH